MARRVEKPRCNCGEGDGSRIHFNWCAKAEEGAVPRDYPDLSCADAMPIKREWDNYCPHCRCDTRCEDHAEDCPCSIVVESTLCNADAQDRQAFLDDLARGWESPVTSDRIRKIYEANRKKEEGNGY